MASDDTPGATSVGALRTQTLALEAPESVSMPHTPGGWPRRYEDLGWLGQGGMGQVRRVRDRRLGKVLAMKILRPGLVGNPVAVRRFVHEARLTAELQHPNIVSAEDIGRLPDRRWWFTMREVHGRTFGSVIAEHLQRTRASDAVQGLRRVVVQLEQVCRGAAFAHAHGVVHRDLKPENVMIGAFGEVFVMDWGLASRMRVFAPAARPRAERRSPNTGALGTPGFMPPEQWAGGRERLGPPSDVWSLGAILHLLLLGAPPSPTDGVLAAIDALRPPGDVRELVGAPGVPGQLLDLCRWCLNPAVSDRPADAQAVADVLRAWIEREERTERAQVAVSEADAALEDIAALRLEAASLRARARRMAVGVPSHAPVDRKAPFWEVEDAATDSERRAGVVEAAHVQALQVALRHAPDFAPALDRLADHYRARVVQAEAAGDIPAASLHEALLATHDRGRHAAWLRGEAAVTLVTDPPGADVLLCEWQTVRRRLALVPLRVVGTTPLVALPVPRGSYVLRVTRAGFAPLDYPFAVGRGEHWDGVGPGATAPYPIRLHPEGPLCPENRRVPAGWFRAGGDPRAVDALSSQRCWSDGFVVRTHPVTHAEYLLFINALDMDSAELRVPREPPGAGGVANALYRRTDDLWQIDGTVGFPADTPVTLLDWHSATAYASWYASRTGRPWRLLHELEREKAARGVDGRFFPWGNTLDPTWACMHLSHAGAHGIAPISAFPEDVSPYGARGLAGNTRDWCANRYVREGVPETPEDESDYRCVRGGSWVSGEDLCRSAARFAARPTDRRTSVGLRIGYCSE
jgi:formylglycine-generating enzyme required for sulfatase activity/tRNA A-37 threonylcarbamoyl transferase component Bud32